ncbi:hypothetical protein SBOR_1541 [Sclerotinia borealis F-4128]|uniref:Uncharacterized protein n=1 Tax=Sclerotinia borealis (strain F-4128) TaxID=1432307 RepID=W9CU91_SCLBF|nr:hypothetical protein SBOR_1541 [Sclerotinia borealis F-4128]
MSHLNYFSYEGYGQRSKQDLWYSQAVRVGDVIECSGQGGWDRSTEAMNSDIVAQIEQAFDNVEQTLQTSGSRGWQDVFSVRSYHVPMNDEALKTMVRCLKKYCPDHQPIWTCIGVPNLAFDAMKVEIEVRAHVPAEKKENTTARIMGTASNVFQASRKIYGQGKEIHGKIQGVQQQAKTLGVSLPKDAPSIPRNRAEFKREAKGHARGCVCGVWTGLKAEAKKYITYVGSLLLFAVISIGLVCFLIPALWYHPHLQLLTLTTKAKAILSDTTRGGNLNATDGESVHYRVYLLHYCVSGLTAKAEKQFNMTNGCHLSKQALHEHILPALSSTFMPPLPGNDVPGPSTDIQTLFKHYGYISFCLYILDIILLPIVAGGFIWWFISTVTPWKRTFRAVLCLFTGTLLAPAVLQSLLVSHTIYILKHNIDMSTSSLKITVEPGFVYLFLIHLFWVALLFNIICFRLIDMCREKRKNRKLRQVQETLEAQNQQDPYGDAYKGHVVATDTLYDTKSYEMEEFPHTKQSVGIARKPVKMNYSYDNGDLGDRKLEM